MTPCTTGCIKIEGVRMEACEFAEDFVNRPPSVGSTLAAAVMEALNAYMLQAVGVTLTCWRLTATDKL